MHIAFIVFFIFRAISDGIFYFKVIKNPNTEENDTILEQFVTVFSTCFSRLKYFLLYMFVAWAEDVRIEKQF